MNKIWLLVISLCCSDIAVSQTLPGNVGSQPFIDESNSSAYDLAILLNNQNTTESSQHGVQRYQRDSVFGFNPKTEPLGFDSHWAAVYRYDNVTNLETSFSYSCSGDNCDLQPSIVIIQEFNTNGQKTGESGAGWDGESYDFDFVLPHMTQYIYENGRLVLSLASEIIKDTFIYNDIGNLISRKSSRIDSNSDTFRLFFGTEYTYTDSNLIESIIQSRSRSGQDEIVPSDSTHFSYYDNGQIMIEQDFFIGSNEPTKWRPFEQLIYTYNVDETINTLRFNAVYRSEPDTTWRYQELREYVYSLDGELDEIFYYNMIDDGNPVLSFKSEYFYDQSVALDEILLPREAQQVEGQQHMLLREHHYYITPRVLGLSPSPFTREYYYIERNPTSTLEIPQLETRVSPNPVQDHLDIELEEKISQPFRLSIYDTHGRLHLELHTFDTRIDVSDLPAGAYIYTIQYLGKSGSGKFIRM